MASNSLGNLSYAYDNDGRRSSVTGSFARTRLPLAINTTAYNANNQLTTWGTANLFYDLNGNMTSDGTHSYTWDARNRLTQMDSGNTASFSYDASGRRSSKTVLSTQTGFFYDGANAVQELSGSTVTANSLMGGIDEVFQRTDSAGARSFLTDALGSTLALTDSTGTTQTSYTFEPFGNTTTTGSATTNSFAYTGRELDATGLYYYRARYYNPQLQRFIDEDPIGLYGGINLYAYAGNNPVTFTDPLGLAKCVYSISTHTLSCTSDFSPAVGPTWQVIVGPDNVSSGNGKCKDNPKCADKLFTGPIKPGNYKMNPDTRPGQTDRYRLEPQPPIPGWKVDLGLERGGFELHPGHRTLGCINVLKDDPNAMQQYNQLRQLLDSQTGSNFLQVVP